MNLIRQICPPFPSSQDKAALVARKARTAIRCCLWRAHQEVRVRRNRLLLLIQEWKLRSRSQRAEFRLWGWYGRIGNNVQQLIIAIAHAETFRGSTGVGPEQIRTGPLDGIVSSFRLDFSNPESANLKKHTICTIFFHYTEYTFSRTNLRRMAFRRGHSPRRECLLGRRAIEAHAHRIAQQYLSPLLLLPPGSPCLRPSEKGALVIHLRSGDVRNLDNSYYITNPLCFYRQLSLQYQKAVIITEPGEPHPLLSSILALFPGSRVVSKSAGEDFISLCMAPHLASSGVGTFAVAAALLSRELKVFHCTDLYQIEHLNPRMIRSDSVEVRMQAMPGFAKQWLRATDRLKLLLTYQPSQ